MPSVAVVHGSRSDLPTLQGRFDVLDRYGIALEAPVMSAEGVAEFRLDQAGRAELRIGPRS